MLRFGLIAVVVAAMVAAGIVFLLPVASGPRPEPRSLAGEAGATPRGFVIHDAPAPPVAGVQPAPVADLDAVMSRLRAAGPKPDAPAVAAAPPAAPLPAVVTPDPAPAAPRWNSVTGQGTRWRMARGPGGYVVSIDLGGGQKADVRVQPAFTALDAAAIAERVDYLRDTILQNFSSRSDSYSFARDGSVSLDR